MKIGARPLSEHFLAKPDYVRRAAPEAKSEQPVNEVRVPQALPEYYIKYSQFENAKSDYFNR